MTDYLAVAQQAAQFIDGQQIEGRAKWRRADQGSGSDYSLYHGSSGLILLLPELPAPTGDPAGPAKAIAAGEGVVTQPGRAVHLLDSA